MFDKAKRISSFLVIRGLLALVFGVLVLALPTLAVVSSLIWVFAIFAIVDGTFAVVGSLASHETFEDWWLLLLAGIMGIMIGVFTFARPGVAALVLVMYIGLRAIISGILEIVFAIRLRKHVEGEWLFVVAGVLSMLFGLALIVWPIAGIEAVVWLIGVYAIAGGAMQLVLAGQVRDWVRRIEDRKTAA
ncbi:MAG TPA: HdeD family acid-resistance protein [Pirellulales bacterium]|jgi:uncharacterized membrane protein HdeD (DUF308 family)|nr:HdeD family acid-resistance protein [Pirellulales bacterium]